MIPIYHLFSKIILCCNTSSVGEVVRSVGDCRGGTQIYDPFWSSDIFLEGKISIFFSNQRLISTRVRKIKVQTRFFVHQKKCQKSSFAVQSARKVLLKWGCGGGVVG